jgi:hypothetical protein
MLLETKKRLRGITSLFHNGTRCVPAIGNATLWDDFLLLAIHRPCTWTANYALDAMSPEHLRVWHSLQTADTTEKKAQATELLFFLDVFGLRIMPVLPVVFPDNKPKEILHTNRVAFDAIIPNAETTALMHLDHADFVSIVVSQCAEHARSLITQIQEIQSDAMESWMKIKDAELAKHLASVAMKE